jgi:hypothetical protein
VKLQPKMVNGFLIDPDKQAIQIVSVADTLDAFHRVIGADCLDSFRLDERNVIFLDDRGLIEGPPFKARFEIRGYSLPLAGKGLVVGVGAGGETRSSSWSAQDLALVVIWSE